MRNQLTKKYALKEEDFQFMFDNAKIMYFREKGSFKWHNNDRMQGSVFCRGKKRGVMIATLHPKNHSQVIIGWSMCHKKYDRFDHERGIYTALGRALAWSNEIRYSTKEASDNAFPTFIPSSMMNDFTIFVTRIARYYKDCVMPEWADSPLIRAQAWCYNDHVPAQYLEQASVN